MNAFDDKVFGFQIQIHTILHSIHEFNKPVACSPSLTGGAAL